MKSALKVMCVFIAVCALPGCATIWMARIYNDTGENKILNTDAQRLDWRKNSSLEFSYPNRTMSFGVSSPNKAWRYKEHFPPDDFISQVGARKTIFLQLQSDGTIYVVHPGAAFPVNAIPSQPAGWPLKPVDSKDNQ